MKTHDGLPDPDGPPEPYEPEEFDLTPGLQVAGLLLGVVLVAGLLLPKVTFRRTAGALHSTRMQWEGRAVQIEQAMVDPDLPTEHHEPGCSP